MFQVKQGTHSSSTATLIMALPPRVHVPRLAASVLLVFTGIAGLAMTLQGRGAALAAVVLGQPFPGWFRANPGQLWQIGQSILVIVGGLGGLAGVFTPTVSGILAGLIFITPVGLLTALPSVLMLLSALLRPRSFYEFMPRWRGPGLRPPGPEYR
ncbi:MAG TPA: hypothetical protein VFS20_18980 [Longimicrobium sp.]|nr:hypothetical protein [Longimicrobium sp.]